MWIKHGKHYRLHGTVDNQPVHLYATAYPTKTRFTVWKIGLHVGGKNRKANDWYNKAKHWAGTTGNGSVKPLLFALESIQDFANKMGRNDEIQIKWQDDRRRRVYSRLLKYGWFLTAERDMYVYRNPKYWEFTGGEVGEFSQP
jgi:hypothetical protein